jgi:hypothetical protein
MPEPINDTEVRDALARVVALAGTDHRYAFPYDGLVRYTWDADSSERGDIIGETLRIIAPDVHTKIREVETSDPGQPVESLYGMADQFAVQLSGAAAAALDQAQIIQDEGGTWGDALTRYDEVYAEYVNELV